MPPVHRARVAALLACPLIAAWLLGSAPAIARADASQVRIDQIGWGCSPGDLTTAFVQLKATGPGQTRDSGLYLTITNGLGSVVSDGPVDFGAHADEPWAQGQTWLLAAGGFHTKVGFAADGALPATLDKFAGSLTFYTLDGSGNPVIVDKFTWGRSVGLPRAPYLGQSLQRVDATTFTVQSAPNPMSSTGATGTGCLGYTPDTAFRIDEIGLTCRVGYRGVRFVELTSLVGGHVFDPNVGLHVQRTDGASILDIAKVFGGAAGQSAAAGTRFLLGSSAFASTGGPTPDGPLITLPDSLAGTLTLYLSNAGNDTETVIHQARYGYSDAVATPPAGSSLQRQADDSFAITSSPTPTNRAGGVSTGSCFGAPTTNAVEVSELGLACDTGTPGVAFIELAPMTGGQVVGATLSLRYYDSHGALLGDLPNSASSLAGRLFPLGQTLLYTTAAMTTVSGTHPDGTLPVALDVAGGRIEVYDSSSPGDVIDQVSYGTSALPAPAAGSSLARGANGQFSTTTSPTPTNFAGVTAALPCFGLGAVPNYRIGEVFLGCYPARGGSRFVRLESTRATYSDAQVGLRVYDAQGQLLADVPHVLGNPPNPFVPGPANYLLTNAAFDTFTGLHGDMQIPVTPDSTGGRLTLYHHDLGTGRDSVLSELVYGAAGVRLPPPGGSIRWQGTTGYAVTYSPTAARSDGVTLATDCIGYAPGMAFSIQELGFNCASGLTSPRYLMLKAGANLVLDPAIGVQCVDHSGAIVLDLPGAFGSLAGQRLITGQALLIANSDFAPSTGLAPDQTVNLGTDPAGGSVEIYSIDYLTSARSTITKVSYGSAVGKAALMPGTCLHATPTGYGPTLVPQPTNRFGAVPTASCYGLHSTAVRIDEVGLRCLSGTPGLRFIDLIAKEDEAHDPSLALRITDSHGHVLADFTSFFGSSSNQLFPLGHRFLLGPANFSHLIGITPDFILPALPDSSGGVITLYILDSHGVEVDLHQLTYGAAGGTFLPPAGGSIRRLGDDTFSVQRNMSPSNEAGVTGQGPCLGGVSDFFDGYSFIQLLTSCHSGGAAGVSYVELATTFGNAYLDGELGIRYYDSHQTLLADLPHAFGPLSWQPAPASSTILFGTAQMATASGVAPDVLLPVPLDTLGGRLVLYDLEDGTGVRTDFNSWTYGPIIAGEAALATGGFSAEPAPRTYTRVTVTAPGCFGPTFPRIGIAQVSAGCAYAPNDGYGGFVELVNRDPAGLVPSFVRLNISGIVVSPFAGHEGESWPLGATWLIGSPGFAQANAGLTPDFEMSSYGIVPGASLQLGIGPAPTAPTTYFQSMTYPSGSPSTAGAGVVIDSSGVITAIAIPTPRNRAGDERDGTPCLGAPVVTHSVRVADFSLGCKNGGTATCFVELVQTPGVPLPAHLSMRVVDSLGVVLEDYPDVIGSNEGLSLPGIAYRLLGNTGFSAAASFPADIEVPLAFNPAGGRIMLYRPGPAGADTIDWVLRYGGIANVGAPPLGSAVNLAGNTYGLVTRAPVRNSHWALVNGVDVTPWTCFDEPVTAQMTFAQALFQCASGDSSLRYVSLNLPAVVALINGTYTQESILPPAIRLRTLDGHGAPLDSVDFVGARRPPEVFITGIHGAMLFGDPALELATGLTPLARTPHMPGASGSLQMVMLDPHLEAIETERELKYGPGAPLLAAPPGDVLTGDNHIDVHPIATDLQFAAPVTGCPDCSGFEVRMGVPPPSNPGLRRVFETAHDDTTLTLGTGTATTTERAYHDGPTGVIGLQVRNLTAGIDQGILDDRFTLMGLPAGTPVPLHVQFLISGSITSPHPTSPGATILTARLTGDAQTTDESWRTWGDTLSRAIHDTLSVDVLVRAGTPFAIGPELKSLATAGGYDADLEGRLQFVGIPGGASIADCRGFGGSPVATLLALASSSTTNGVVKLAWAGADRVGTYGVERRKVDQAWTHLADVRPDANGLINFTDGGVSGGSSYDYRLTRSGAPASPETWIDVPTAAVFALLPLSPHPVTGDLNVSFSLAKSDPTMLAVYDIAGRQIVRREVGALGVGRHVVTLVRRGDLRAGMYVIRLTRQGEERHLRAIVVQ